MQTTEQLDRTIRSAVSEDDLRNLALTSPEYLVGLVYSTDSNIGLRCVALDALGYLVDKKKGFRVVSHGFSIGHIVLQECALGAMGRLATEEAIEFVQQVANDSSEHALIQEIAKDVLEDHREYNE